MAHKLNIVLANTNPKIYRKVIIPERFSFDDLHTVIQVVMGWQNEHLYQFNLGAPYNSDTIRLRDEENEELGVYGKRFDEFDSETTNVGDVLSMSKKKISYIYDFGDDWIHEITVMAKPQEDVKVPICIEGEHSAPVEDCGGIWGFYEMLETLNFPEKAEEKKDLRAWLGLKKNQTYDTVFGFDLVKINKTLVKVFS